MMPTQEDEKDIMKRLIANRISDKKVQSHNSILLKKESSEKTKSSSCNEDNLENYEKTEEGSHNKLYYTPKKDIKNLSENNFEVVTQINSTTDKKSNFSFFSNLKTKGKIKSSFSKSSININSTINIKPKERIKKNVNFQEQFVEIIEVESYKKFVAANNYNYHDIHNELKCTCTCLMF